ncbi:hypothetical protein ON010_g4354 [Phytophthora cinnamomi]|nr:hypothetical protein ON010_g4354 [Phytophthora cinnamomi]
MAWWRRAKKRLIMDLKVEAQFSIGLSMGELGLKRSNFAGKTSAHLLDGCMVRSVVTDEHDVVEGRGLANVLQQPPVKLVALVRGVGAKALLQVRHIILGGAREDVDV